MTKTSYIKLLAKGNDNELKFLVLKHNSNADEKGRLNVSLATD